MIDRRRFVAAAGAGLVLPALAAPAVGAVLAPTGDMSLGNPKAKVRVVEYASASCPHCAHFNNEVFPAFKKKYVDTGRVYYTLKEFLTDPAEFAMAGFLLARCAGKAQYFPVLDSVFHAQDGIYQSGDLRAGLWAVAQKHGITEAQFNACLTDQAAIKALGARANAAVQKDKITATPSFVINGRKVEGAMTLAELDAAVAKAAKSR